MITIIPSQKFISANTRVLFFDNVVLIKGCVISPNVLLLHFFTCYLNGLLTRKLGLIIDPISNSSIRSPVSSIQIKRLAICHNSRR